MNAQLQQNLFQKLEFDFGSMLTGSHSTTRRSQNNKAVSFKEPRASLEEDKQDIFMEKIASV